jgi:hypothetical protein
MGEALRCEHFEVSSGWIASTHFPVIFESLSAIAELRGGDGTEKASIVVTDRRGVEVGGCALRIVPAARMRRTTTFRLLAARPDAYTARLVVNDKAIAETTFQVHQTPSVQRGAP